MKFFLQSDMEQASSAEEIAISVQEVSGLLEITSKEVLEMAEITEEIDISLDQLKIIIQNEFHH